MVQEKSFFFLFKQGRQSPFHFEVTLKLNILFGEFLATRKWQLCMQQFTSYLSQTIRIRERPKCVILNGEIEFQFKLQVN